MSEKKQNVESRLSIMTLIGLAILLFCYLGAIWNVFQVKKDEVLLGKKIIRLCHWQLEMGVRGALDEMGKRYEAIHPESKFIQIPLTERVYAQWVTTQLIGRTAPDLIEIGMFRVNEYLGRYFVPLTDELRKPNPYNKDTDLKNTPWMETFTDGLQNAYIPELVDYYSVGLSQFNIRMFYNKDLFKRIVGSEKAPKTLDELFAICEKIKAYASARNAEIDAYNANQPRTWLNYVPFMAPDTKPAYLLSPIASSRYQVPTFQSRYGSMLTAFRAMELDLSMSGSPAPIDFLYALVSGDLSIEEPHYKVYNEIIRNFALYFPRGFMSIDRMDSGFGFIQGRALMIISGSWDASSYIKQAHDQPFGDVILSVNGTPVSNAAEASKLLMAASGSVKIVANREGFNSEYLVKPAKGDSLWKRYGIELDDFEAEDGSGKMVPVVADLDPISPADKAGLMKRKRFEIGIVEPPPPTKNTPIYGKFYVGQVAETSSTGFSFGIVKFTKNYGMAIDFLRFCTNPENNQKLNEIAQWIPAIKGAKPTPFLAQFTPNYEGYWGALNLDSIGMRSKTRIQQMFWPYVSGEINFKQFAEGLDANLPTEVAYDFVEMLRASGETVPDKHIIRSLFLKDFIFAGKNAKLREDSKRRLASCWDIILDKQLERQKIMSIMGPLIDKRPKNKFATGFFGVYDNLSGDKSVQGGN